MVSRCLYALIACLALVAVAGVTTAEVITEPLDSDEELNARLPSSQKVVVAEGRIGNNQSNGDFEMDLGPSTSAPQTQADFIWPNGSAVAFALDYDGSADAYTFTLAPGATEETTLSVSGLGPISDLFFRARAVKAGSTMTLSNLTLDGEAIPAVSADGDAGGLGLLHVGGPGVFDGSWSLLGDATKAWDESTPTNSNLAFQIKGGFLVTPIPEPASVALLGVGGLFMLRRRRAD